MRRSEGEGRKCVIEIPPPIAHTNTCGPSGPIDLDIFASTAARDSGSCFRSVFASGQIPGCGIRLQDREGWIGLLTCMRRVCALLLTPLPKFASLCVLHVPLPLM